MGKTVRKETTERKGRPENSRKRTVRYEFSLGSEENGKKRSMGKKLCGRNTPKRQPLTLTDYQRLIRWRDKQKRGPVIQEV